jgi:hypothetical protein
MWESLSEYPQFVQEVIYIIDYDTEVQMEGLDSFLTNSSGQHFRQTCQALQNCGAIREADILGKANAIDWEGEGAEEQYSEFEKQMALQNDYEAFWTVQGAVQKLIKLQQKAIVKSKSDGKK